MLNLDHTPGYVWPNPAFPFREYFSHPNLRIFIIENIQHNWNWLKNHSRRFQARDHFFVYSGWYFDEWFLKQDLQVFDALGLDKEKFFFMFNCQESMDRYKSAGFKGELINHNCWLDWNGVMQPDLNAEKIYDAVYVGRFTPFKRHHLASKIDNLALVTGELMGGQEANELPPHTFRNESQLDEASVAKIINQSRVGVILSESEGACFASSEYLLCGLPVVSTHSKGGRDVWYDRYNSIVVPPDAAKVAEAVRHFIENPTDPMKIRHMHIEQSIKQRELFISHLQKLFLESSVSIDAKDLFDQNYIHKLRKSEGPQFNLIWP